MPVILAVADTGSGQYAQILPSLLWFTFVLGVVLTFRRQLTLAVDVLMKRLEQGANVTVGPIALGQIPLITKTNDLPEQPEVFGNPDRLKLLFKVKGKDFVKSTKAIDVPGGCVVQVSTERRMADGTWSAAEAVTFVPNVMVVDEIQGKGRYLSLKQEA